MRNKVEFHDKKWEKKSNVVSTESIPTPVFPFSVCYCYLYISVVEYSLHTDSFFFQDKVKCSFFLCKVVASVSNRNVYEML